MKTFASLTWSFKEVMGNDSQKHKEDRPTISFSLHNLATKIQYSNKEYHNIQADPPFSLVRLAKKIQRHLKQALSPDIVHLVLYYDGKGIPYHQVSFYNVSNE